MFLERESRLDRFLCLLLFVIRLCVSGCRCGRSSCSCSITIRPLSQGVFVVGAYSIWWVARVVYGHDSVISGTQLAVVLFATVGFRHGEWSYMGLDEVFEIGGFGIGEGAACLARFCRCRYFAFWVPGSFEVTA